jgi:DnaJ-class molecular chaperone
LLCTEDDLKDEVKLKKLYKQAARKYHPDFNNGNGSMMSELNAAWSAYNAQ